MFKKWFFPFILAVCLCLPVLATVTDNYAPVQLETDGAEDEFDFGFKVFADTDLVVAVIDETTLVSTAQTLTTDYTVTRSTTVDGGTITFVSAPADANYVSITRNIPGTQATRIPRLGLFKAKHLENALDKLTLLVQENEDALDRTPSFILGSETSDIVFPEPVTDTVIGWNTAADALETKTLAGLPVATTGNFLYYNGTSWVETDKVSLVGGVLTATGNVVGNINGTVGGTTPAAGAFTTITSTGNVNFDGGAIYNTSSADKDFRIKSDTLSDALYLEGSSGFLGLQTADPEVRLHVRDVSTGNASFFETYSTNNNDNSAIHLRKSSSGTIGNKAETASGEANGTIHFLGVGSAGGFGKGASIYGTQNGAAGASYVPTVLRLVTYSPTAQNASQLVLHNTGAVMMGTDTPIGTGLNISNGGLSLVLGANDGAKTKTNVTAKKGRIVTPHWTNAEEPMAMISSFANENDNHVFIGGYGTSSNAATKISFYTAANTTTVEGTRQLEIASDGTATFTGGIKFPTSDPSVAGAWWDNSGTLTKSSG